jgi:selenocysteine lyase/cysteine desulfurase
MRFSLERRMKMDLGRRQFLVTGGLLAATALAPSRLLAAVERHTPPMPDLSRWPDVRAQFSLVPGLLHFSSFYLASHPRPVRDAVDAFRRALDENPLHTVEHGMFEGPNQNLQVAVCREIAPYLGANPDEIALTGNTTMGLALVYHGLPLKAGDEILTTTHDHFVHHESIRLAAERRGVTVRRIPLFTSSARAATDEIVQRVEAGIRPATRVLGVTWVHSSTGVRLPIRAIADAVARANRGRDETRRVRLVVDGVHGLGALDENVADLGGDYFCAGTHKWMFAPRGTGIVWARAENWARLRPTVPTFSRLEAFEAWKEGKRPPITTAADVSPGGFHAYEHQWAMGAAFRFHRQIGRARVAGRIRELNDALKVGLAGMPNVTLHTPRDPALSAGIACFEVRGSEPERVVQKLLDRKVVASTSPYRVSYARLSASLVNTPAEVESALRAVRDVAGV